jgi:hypothetical protein
VTLPDNKEAGLVYDEVLGMMGRLSRSSVPDGLVAKILFAIGVKALLREGYDVDEIRVFVAEVAALEPAGRGQA